MAMQTDADRTVLRFLGTYGEADLEALAHFTVSRFLDRRIGRAAFYGILLLAIGALLMQSWLAAVGGLVLILAVSALMRYVVLPRKLVRHAMQTGGSGQNRAIVMDEQGVRCLVDGVEQPFPWSVVGRLLLRKKHLFILLKPGGCVMLPLAWIQPPVTVKDVVNHLAQRNHV